MTRRRSFGLLALLAMIHFIIAGTAAVCAPSSHTECAPAGQKHHDAGTDGSTAQPCCVALSSCTVAPLASRSLVMAVTVPHTVTANRPAERGPSAESPAPEPPPPRV